jgi:hypothetical protein
VISGGGEAQQGLRLELELAATRSADAAKTKRQKKVGKPVPTPRPVSQWTAHDLTSLFNRRWRERWESKPPAPTKVDVGKLANLLKEYGGESCRKAVEYFFDRFDALALDFGWDGYPSFALLYGYRKTIVPRAVDGERPAPPRRPPARKHEVAQHVEELDRPSGSEGGWE